MVITKHISLDEECIKKMAPYVERHKENFSLAIREIIKNAEGATIPKDASAIDDILLGWLLSEMEGRLIPDDILDNLIDPLFIKNLDRLKEHVNLRLRDLGWKCEIDIDYDKCEIDIDYDKYGSSPSNIMIDIMGGYQKTKLIASLISKFIIKNSDDIFAVKCVVSLNNGIKVELCRATNRKEGFESLITFFGGLEDIAKAIKDHPTFWRCIINRHILSNYQMVTVHRNYFEDMLAGKVPMGEITIETIAKKPIQDISLKEILPLIKKVYEGSRVVDKVDIKNETIILFHSLREKEAIEKIKKSLIILLEASGHLYNAKMTSNMIVLTHRPDVGIKINEIVNKLKDSDNKLDHELIIFLSFLKELKNIPDIHSSIAILGRRIGKGLLQEYEKEHNIRQWNLENFQKAFETIDSKIHRDSEWKIEGKNLLYRVKKCNISMEGDSFDTFICRTAREAFKGALTYAFGYNAELIVRKLISHGDNICEVCITLDDNHNNLDNSIESQAS